MFVGFDQRLLNWGARRAALRPALFSKTHCTADPPLLRYQLPHPESGTAPFCGSAFYTVSIESFFHSFKNAQLNH